MKPIRINTLERYQEIVARYGIKGGKSNDYIQREAADLIIQNVLYECCGDKNAFLLVKKEGFWRVYYYINDTEEKWSLDNEELVTEILFRGSNGKPIEEINYLESCGFKCNLVRDQYFATYSSLTPPVSYNNLTVEHAFTIEDVKWAINLFNDTFDKWSGDYVSLEMAEPLLLKRAILIAKDLNRNKLGAMHFEIKKGTTWLKHLVVSDQSRGMGVGRCLFEASIECGHINDDSRYILWVQKNNAPAANFYQKKGFIYMNKSTLSMIKL